MRYARYALAFAVLLPLAGCAGRLSSRTAREQIAELGGAAVLPADVRIERIVAGTGRQMIAETTVKMTFQFDRDPQGAWRIVMARLGDGPWLDIETLLGAIERQRREEAVEAFRKLATGLERYRQENGRFPETPPDGHVGDLLHPLFMADFIRLDPWGAAIRYETDAGRYRLRSAGADGAMDTEDDVVLEGPPDSTMLE